MDKFTAAISISLTMMREENWAFRRTCETATHAKIR